MAVVHLRWCRDIDQRSIHHTGHRIDGPARPPEPWLGRRWYSNITGMYAYMCRSISVCLGIFLSKDFKLKYVHIDARHICLRMDIGMHVCV